MSNPNSQGNTKAPQFSKEYEKGLQVYLKYLPQELQTELANRAQYDPAFLEQAMGIQEKYDPRLAQEQHDALARRDPQWLATHQALGDKVQQALQRGYVDPVQKNAYDQYALLAKSMARTAGQTDPTRNRAYQALGQQVTGDTLRGGTADPAALRQMTQAILARSPTLSYGEAQNQAAAVYTGQRAQALEQQRQQATGQFLQTATPEQQSQQSLLQAGQGLGQFYGQTSPEQNAMALAGTYIQPSNSLVNAENMIGGVQAPSSLRYVNPNAGYQGVQFGLQNYQNQLAQQQTQGGGNPWTNALQGAGQGASMGSNFGGYGAAGGAVTGAVAGYLGYPQFSDSRWKKNLSRTGFSTADGIPVMDYDMDGRRWRGVLAQDVAEVRPDAVYRFPDGRLGVFYSKLGIEQREVN